MSRISVCLFALALLSWSTTSRADDERERARTYFNAGVQAYQAGQFLEAGQAFLEARKLLKKPELLFSAAQAFRRQFDVDQKEEHLRIAVTHYRQYLKEVKEGGRRLEVARALSDLAPFIAKLDGTGGEESFRFATRLMVSCSAPGAVARLDGGPPRRIPLSATVKRGMHQLVVMAPGYHPEKRQIEAIEGRLVALDVTLRGQPARLKIEGADGAEVLIDGRSLGDAPLEPFAQVDAGRHFIAVTKHGREPYGAELELRHGATTTVELDLPITNQQRVAYGLFGASGGALIAAGVLTGLAFEAQDEAHAIGELQTAGTIQEDQRVAHNDAVERRDRLATAAVVTAGTAGLVAVAALFLVAIDQPEAVRPSSEPSDDKRRSPEPKIDVLAGTFSLAW
jgi:hypothetical protein